MRWRCDGLSGLVTLVFCSNSLAAGARSVPIILVGTRPQATHSCCESPKGGLLDSCDFSSRSVFGRAHGYGGARIRLTDRARTDHCAHSLMRISAAAAALALSLAAPAAGADAHCSRQIDCHSCTRQNADPGFDSVCAWCFSTGSCSLAYSRASPSLSDWLAGPGLCRDSTTDPGVCKCRPDEYTSCDAVRAAWRTALGACARARRARGLLEPCARVVAVHQARRLRVGEQRDIVRRVRRFARPRLRVRASFRAVPHRAA